MEGVYIGLDKLNSTLEIVDLIDEERETIDLVVAVRVIIGSYVNPDALLKVFQRVWVKKGALS